MKTCIYILFYDILKISVTFNCYMVWKQLLFCDMVQRVSRDGCMFSCHGLYLRSVRTWIASNGFHYEVVKFHFLKIVVKVMSVYCY